MKNVLNFCVLFTIFSTSLPFQSSYAQEVGDDVSEETSIEMPFEAVAASEELVAANQTAPKEVSEAAEEGPSCIRNGVAYSPKMTKEQKKELFVYGKITDCDGRIWNIKIIPGSDVSKQMTIKSWRYASNQTKELIKIETYKDAARSGKNATRASFDFTKRSSKLLKKGIWDYMIVDGIYESLLVDTKNTWFQAGAAVKGLRGSFGWIFGAIYAGILKPVTLTAVNVVKAAYHITKGTVVLVGGIAGTAGGIVATVSSPVIVPAADVLTRPLLAIGSILTTGSIIPGTIYLWNGSAWITSQLNDVPTEETRIGGVTFVRLENPRPIPRNVVNVTIEDFKKVVEASLLASVLESKQEELEAKQDDLRRQIAELQREIDDIEGQQRQLRAAHNSHPVVIAIDNMRRNQYGADVRVSEDVQEMILDDAKIKEIVINYANEMDILLTDEEMESTIKAIKKAMGGTAL